MSEPNFILLYVNDPMASAEFYGGLLGLKPVEASPNFVMFLWKSGMRFGLWARHDVEPKAAAQNFGGEIGLEAGTDAEVADLHTAWSARGVRIAQAPTRMDFGFTFVGLDPDGHRLRVFAPALRG